MIGSKSLVCLTEVDSKFASKLYWFKWAISVIPKLMPLEFLFCNDTLQPTKFTPLQGQLLQFCMSVLDSWTKLSQKSNFEGCLTIKNTGATQDLCNIMVIAFHVLVLFVSCKVSKFRFLRHKIKRVLVVWLKFLQSSLIILIFKSLKQGLLPFLACFYFWINILFAVSAPHVHMNTLNYAPIFIHSWISCKIVDVSHCTSCICFKILSQCVPHSFKEGWAGGCLFQELHLWCENSQFAHWQKILLKYLSCDNSKIFFVNNCASK